jgi:hypothetical protein
MRKIKIQFGKLKLIKFIIEIDKILNLKEGQSLYY